ncbi:sulfoquinovosyl transferase [Pseudoscourfieldia marina]
MTPGSSPAGNLSLLPPLPSHTSRQISGVSRAAQHNSGGVVNNRRTTPPLTLEPVQASAESAVEVDEDCLLEPPTRRVAVIVEPSPFSHVSGMKNRFLQLIRTLRGAGDEVLVVTPDPNCPEFYHGAKCQHVAGFRLPLYGAPTLLLSLGLSIRLFVNLWKLKPHVIHVSSPGLLVFASILYSRLLHVPLVVSYHTHIPEYIPRYTWRGLVEPMWSVIRFCSRAAHRTLVTSTIMRDELGQHGVDNIGVWPKGVDTDRFHPRFREGGGSPALMRVATPPAELDDADVDASPLTGAAMRKVMTGGRSGKLLICVGRLGAEKNLFDLKDILAKVQQTPGLEDTSLCLVGDGPSRKELEAHFEGTNTVFLGMVTGDDLSQAYANGDVFVMPSESETLGFVVLEAMASGVPCVAVAAGGLLDIIEDGRTGLFYPSGDFDKAAELTVKLLKDDKAREELACSSRREAERFGWAAATGTLRRCDYTIAIRHHRERRKWSPLSMLRRFLFFHLPQFLRRKTTIAALALLTVGVHFGYVHPIAFIKGFPIKPVLLLVPVWLIVSLANSIRQFRQLFGTYDNGRGAFLEAN